MIHFFKVIMLKESMYSYTIVTENDTVIVLISSFTTEFSVT
jgi:hypothetical protein